MASNAPLLPSAYAAGGGERLPDYDEVVHEARKPGMLESFRCEMVTGTLVLFIGHK